MLILKIIGIILLVILGLILTVILLVLFVPVRYSFKGVKGTGTKEINAKAVVSWLLSIARITFSYDDNGAVLTVRLFGFPIKKKVFGENGSEAGDEEEDKPVKEKSSLSEHKPESVRVKEPAVKEAAVKEPAVKEPTIKELSDPDSMIFKIESADDSDDEADDNAAVSPECRTDNCSKESAVKKDAETSAEESSPKSEIKISEDSGTSAGKDEKSPGIVQKIKDVVAKITALFKKAADTVRGLFTKTEETVGHLRKEYNFYSRFINDERNKAAMSKCLKALKRLLESIRPRKTKGYIHFGFDDPSSTGTALAALSVIYPVWPKKLKIDPEFGNNILEGNILIRGRVFIFIVLWEAAIVYFDKNFKRFLRIYKKHKNGNR